LPAINEPARFDRQIRKPRDMMISLLLDLGIIIIIVALTVAVIIIKDIVVEKPAGSVVRRAGQRRDFLVVELLAHENLLELAYPTRMPFDVRLTTRAVVALHQENLHPVASTSIHR
jgi:hypothetical protein